MLQYGLLRATQIYTLDLKSAARIENHLTMYVGLKYYSPVKYYPPVKYHEWFLFNCHAEEVPHFSRGYSHILTWSLNVLNSKYVSWINSWRKFTWNIESLKHANQYVGTSSSAVYISW